MRQEGAQQDAADDEAFLCARRAEAQRAGALAVAQALGPARNAGDEGVEIRLPDAHGAGQAKGRLRRAANGRFGVGRHGTLQQPDALAPRLVRGVLDRGLLAHRIHRFARRAGRLRPRFVSMWTDK
ncbi:MAG TPA: hypothetical protein VL049_26955 [Candidatus Dormibacteraeota bacterium]|nr:hypothetical protein [Candidatus Dormibacteraeota bacterium]